MSAAARHLLPESPYHTTYVNGHRSLDELPNLVVIRSLALMKQITTSFPAVVHRRAVLRKPKLAYTL